MCHFDNMKLMPANLRTWTFYESSGEKPKEEESLEDNAEENHFWFGWRDKIGESRRTGHGQTYVWNQY